MCILKNLQSHGCANEGKYNGDGNWEKRGRRGLPGCMRLNPSWKGEEDPSRKLEEEIRQKGGALGGHLSTSTDKMRRLGTFGGTWSKKRRQSLTAIKCRATT